MAVDERPRPLALQPEAQAPPQLPVAGIQGRGVVGQPFVLQAQVEAVSLAMNTAETPGNSSEMS